MLPRMLVLVCVLFALASCARQTQPDATQNPLAPSAVIPSVTGPVNGQQSVEDIDESGEWSGSLDVEALNPSVPTPPQLLEAPDLQQEVSEGLRLITFTWSFQFRRPSGSNLYKVFGYLDAWFDRLTLPRGTRLRGELTYSLVGGLYTVQGGEKKVRFNLPSRGFTSACPVPRNLRDVFRIVNLSRSSTLFRVNTRWSSRSKCT